MILTVWNVLCEHLGIKQDVIHAWKEIIHTHYSEPQRHYHTLDHLQYMLSTLNECIQVPLTTLFSVQPEYTSLVLAIYFHDIIYIEGLKNLIAGTNPVRIKTGIEKAVLAVVKEIEAMAVPVKGKADARLDA